VYGASARVRLADIFVGTFDRLLDLLQTQQKLIFPAVSQLVARSDAAAAP